MDRATGSLSGIKVIDASRVLGGPYAGQILGDHGADVIKVEPPAGDETRGWGPPFQDGTASYFPRPQPQQARHGTRPDAAGGTRRAAQPARDGGYLRRELQDRDVGPLGPRARRARAPLPPADPLPRLRLRRGRAARRPPRLRRRHPGAVRHHERQRRSGRRAVAGRAAGGRHCHRAERRHRHTHGPARTDPKRQRAIRRGHALRLRRLAAASAFGQPLRVRRRAAAQRQRPSQHRAL